MNGAGSKSCEIDVQASHSFSFQSVIVFRKGNTLAVDAEDSDWNGPNVNISSIGGFVAFNKWSSICIVILNIGAELRIRPFHRSVANVNTESPRFAGIWKRSLLPNVSMAIFASHTFRYFSSYRCNKWYNLFLYFCAAGWIMVFISLGFAVILICT